jgi:hypothetical protein
MYEWREDTDERNGNCTTAFDAGIYVPSGVRAFSQRSNLLLQTVAREPKFTGCRVACDDLGDRSTDCSNIPDACRK